MPLTLDNRTQTIVQVAVSTMLFFVMLIAWRTQKTYPGFGRWTVNKLPHALGWLLVSLRGMIPDWASVFVGNMLIFVSPILLYEGIRQFRNKPYRDVFNYGLMILLIGLFLFYTWPHPSVNARLVVIAACTMLVILRCAWELFTGAPRLLRPSYWFTATVFGSYGIMLAVQVANTWSQPVLSSPFVSNPTQNLFYMATIVMPIGWTFGFFMMTNDRLTLELRTAEIELREMAATDFLTGVYNRRSFVELAQREIVHAQRNRSSLALLMFDIDHFKDFNDSYGHAAGDAMLCACVAACHANLRAIDLLARWGGDEFVVLLPETDYCGSRTVAEKLCLAVAEVSVPVGLGQARTTTSFGGTLWRLEDADLDEAMRRADMALYQAKQHGRNNVVIDPEV